MRYAKRPWGFWLLLLERKHFKVKLLYFKRGGKLSMQRHKDRHELWLFLKGEGHMAYSTPPNKGDVKHIRPHRWHQYTATTKTLVLEIQYGTRCEESDIERV